MGYSYLFFSNWNKFQPFSGLLKCEYDPDYFLHKKEKKKNNHGLSMHALDSKNEVRISIFKSRGSDEIGGKDPKNLKLNQTANTLDY